VSTACSTATASVRLRTTNLGTLIARSMLERTGADVALMNSGGIRDSLPAGRITMRDVLTVQPFGNLVCVVRMSGAELLSYLQAAARMTPNSGAFPQTAGVRLVIVNNQLESATIGGQPIDPKRDYRLAVNSFTASGGDGYPKINTHPGFINTGFMLRDFKRDGGRAGTGDAVRRFVQGLAASATAARADIEAGATARPPRWRWPSCCAAWTPPRRWR
jgi:2',3'-cyclic-nucleotide 2'-phosphodiesterase (5'-nucleotidase family)